MDVFNAAFESEAVCRARDSGNAERPVTRYPTLSGGRYPLPGRLWRPLPVTQRKNTGVTRYPITSALPYSRALQEAPEVRAHRRLAARVCSSWPAVG